MLGREARLGCEATFSPDLNLCHLDSCLVRGDGRQPCEWGPKSGEDLGVSDLAAAGILFRGSSCFQTCSYRNRLLTFHEGGNLLRAGGRA